MSDGNAISAVVFVAIIVAVGAAVSWNDTRRATKRARAAANLAHYRTAPGVAGERLLKDEAVRIGADGRLYRADSPTVDARARVGPSLRSHQQTPPEHPES
jgi:hypothetical protein